jgi:hypothetical protein
MYRYAVPSDANTWTVGTYSIAVASMDRPAVETSPTPVTPTVT